MNDKKSLQADVLNHIARTGVHKKDFADQVGISASKFSRWLHLQTALDRVSIAKINEIIEKGKTNNNA